MMFDHVNPNSEVVFSARRENAVTDLLNQIPSISANADAKTYSSRLITVPVRLDHADSVEAGELIGFMYFGDEFAQSIAPDSWNTGARLGIVRSAMRKNEIADVAVLGAVPASVTIKDVLDGYAEPDQNGKLVSCGYVTQFQILTAQEKLEAGKQQTCMVFITSPVDEPEKYRGPFTAELNEDRTKIKISAGYLNRNGLVIAVPQADIEWGTGYLCIHSEIKDSDWTVPEFKIVSAPSQTYYPVAWLSETNGVKRIDQFHVPMAFIIVSKPCPVAGA